MEAQRSMMAQTNRISGKDLGTLALPNACDRCFWIKRRAAGKLPFQIFPGIFSSIDSYSKHVVHSWFYQNGAAPPWLGELGDIQDYIDPPHHSKFSTIDPDTGILLTGAPDALFRMRDGSLVVADYKTAKHTGNQDKLFPMYQIQLNAYAIIAEDLGLGPVSGLTLIYTEPITDQEAAADDAARCDDGFVLAFAAKLLHVDLDPARVRTLLRRARNLLGLSSPPRGRDGCNECRNIDGLAMLVIAPSNEGPRRAHD
jgi:hypothetical protein